MRIDIITLFRNCSSAARASLGKAIEKNDRAAPTRLRDDAPHRDDAPFGSRPGMVMKASRCRGGRACADRTSDA